MKPEGEQTEFIYSSENLSGGGSASQRFFEILPGFLSWSLMIGMVLLSVFSPVIAVVGIIVFDVFWICFMLHSFLIIVASGFRIKIDRHVDWRKRLEDLGKLDLLKPIDPMKSDSFPDKVSQAVYRHKLRRLELQSEPIPDWEEIYHVIILTITDEDRKLITASVESILNQDFPLERIIVIIAAHENASRPVKETAWNLHREHFETFGAFYVAPHPDNDPEEEPAKGAAMNFGARMAVSALEQRGVDPENVVISGLDARTLLSPGYITCLTWNFLYHPDRDRICFQPYTAYHPNIWNTPGYSSVLHVGSSFFLRVETASPDGLVAFSSFSMSLKLLMETGYWPEEEFLADDSAFFWKSYLKMNGGTRVVPIYTTISFDDIKPESFFDTVKTIYQRKLCEASALYNLPVIFRGFLAKGEIGVVRSVRHVIKILSYHVGMATWIFLLLIIGWLPGWLAIQTGGETSLGYIASRIHSVIIFLALTSLGIAAILSILQLPRSKPEFPPKNWLQHLSGWIFLPIVALILNSFPYLVVQTRMMFGRK